MPFPGINIFKEQNGSTLVLFSLFLVSIIGMAGLVIDIGEAYDAKSHMKKAATAAVLSGAQELVNSEDKVEAVARKILRAHGEEGSIAETYIDKNNEHKFRIVLQKNVETKFLRLFKIYSLPVKAASAACIYPMSRAEGAVPLGIDERIPLEYMKEYTLKVDSGESQYGYFGILALSGPGANLYEHDLMYGYDGELKVGDIVDTQTGNIEGKTRNAINYRINSSPYLEGDISHRDDPRVMLVLVYQPYNVQSNQMKQVKITGFAYFYLKSPMDKHDSSIKGYFIKRVGTGYGDNGISNNGAYAIRLTE